MKRKPHWLKEAHANYLVKYALSLRISKVNRRPYSHSRQQKRIKELQANLCIVCWTDDKKQARGHHLIPFSEDGGDNIINFVTLCDECHKKYHAGKLNIDIYRF
ncbi:HNH endonuclease [Enterobacter hormaechei]|uniref:HNH endonuclease n=1 Tax=Enterobacter TaxID=547 RepID=UPI000F83E8C1|nr:HNH endonuclease [Enterobacter hormaechei]